MVTPAGLKIEPSSELTYLGYYEQRKLMSLFLHKAVKQGYMKELINYATPTIEVERTYYGQRTISMYTFDKGSVKRVLNGVIKKEKELKSMFIHYSNALSNSKITLELSKYDLTSESIEGTPTIPLLTEIKEKVLSDVLQGIKEVKPLWKYEHKSYSISSLEERKKNSKFVVYDESEYSKGIVYSAEEIQNSDKLLEMLDISFEKSESKITSLKTGKLDIPKIAEVLSGNHHIYFKREEVEKTKPFSVCILCDESGSMEGTRYFMQHSLVKTMYRAFSQILSPDKLYVYGHTGDDTPVIHVYQDKYNPYFEKTFGKQYDIELQQNYDGPVCDLIYEKIRSYTSDNILFIVISDGQPAGCGYGGVEDWNDYKRVIEKCKRDGFVTCGIGIQYFYIKDLYQYSTVVGLTADDVVKNVSSLINNVVKSEFQ
jgi:hypothetical protein